jgi:hypothetical protein
MMEPQVAAESILAAVEADQLYALTRVVQPCLFACTSNR